MTVLVYLRWPEACFRANKGDLDFLRSLLPLQAKVIEARSERGFLKALSSATHVVTWHFKSEWYARAPRLALVATPAAGRELVAPPPAGSRCAVHYGGFHGALISESVLAFILAWTHGFFQVRSMPLWPRAKLAEVVNRDLAGSRAVVLGYGRIGRAIAKRLEGFGVTVFGYSRHLKISPSALDRELRREDWLIVSLPSDTGTDDLISADLLKKLPKTCVLVNIGRGNCVDETALLAALRAGRLAGAYLDVYKHEPTVLATARKRLGKGETDIAGLDGRKCPWNLIRMPHAAAYSPSYLKASFQELKDDRCI